MKTKQVSGSKFYYLRNAAALLEMALVNYAMTFAAARGFTPIMTPDLVKEAVLEKCGFQPRADNTQVHAEHISMKSMRCFPGPPSLTPQPSPSFPPHVPTPRCMRSRTARCA